MNIPELTHEELRSYVEFMLYQFRRTDGFWFLGVEKDFGYDAAIRLNEGVWHRMGRIVARDIGERFGIQEKGLKGLAKFFRYFPWAMIAEYEIEVKDDEIIVSVPHCPSQEARLRKGAGEYICKEMHRGEFTSIAGEIDRNIKVECVFAPPDPHPEGLFCKWRFTVGEEGGAEEPNL